MAGASAQREHDRRAARREQQIRTQHPRLRGLLLALTDAPSSTRVWPHGAAGERAVGAELDELSGEHVVALHDRRMRRPDGRLSRANIDHLAVAAGGVWVIDAKTHRGTLEVRRSGGLFGPRAESLYIAGRDRTSLVRGLLDQVAAVRAELLKVQADVPVRRALCFVGTELPWFSSSSIVDVPLVGRRGLSKLLRAPGDLQPEDRDAVAALLDQRFLPPSRPTDSRWPFADVPGRPRVPHWPADRMSAVRPTGRVARRACPARDPRTPDVSACPRSRGCRMPSARSETGRVT